MKSSNHSFALAYSCATLLLARELTKLETDKARKEKKESVLKKKFEMFVDTFKNDIPQNVSINNIDTLLRHKWGHDRAITLLVDLSFFDPFSPYELKYSEKDYKSALCFVGNLIGISNKKVDDIIRTKKKAIAAHKHIAWGKVAIFSAIGIVVCGVGGWLVAPLIGSAIGAASGLVGIAATSHGLAVLGCGSLALGGLGMAGGMWVVTGTGVLIGTVTIGGSALLLQIGAAQTKVELTKLQVYYREVILINKAKLGKAKKVILELNKRKHELETKLSEEELLNESNSRRIKDLKDIIEAITDSIKWMENEKNPLSQNPWRVAMKHNPIKKMSGQAITSISRRFSRGSKR